MNVAHGDWSLVTSAATLMSIALGCRLLIAGQGLAAQPDALQQPRNAKTETFEVQGVVEGLPADGRTVVIRHEAIPNYMVAMTMPFNVKRPGELAGLRIGAEIRFRLRVSDTESWVEGIVTAPRAGQASGLACAQEQKSNKAGETPALPSRHPLLDYPFTNELGQPVRLSDFRGQALAITFFFTRCPIPDYCPRLSRNFEEASQKLSALPAGPTNWHFLSVTFDPEFDTPAVLKAYGQRYQYDPKQWSFVTGPTDKIRELAIASGITLEGAGGAISHNFRTLIIDATGHLQMVFPIGGNLADAVVAEVLKASAASAPPPEPNDENAAPWSTAFAR